MRQISPSPVTTTRQTRKEAGLLLDRRDPPAVGELAKKSSKRSRSSEPKRLSPHLAKDVLEVLPSVTYDPLHHGVR